MVKRAHGEAAAAGDLRGGPTEIPPPPLTDELALRADWRSGGGSARIIAQFAEHGPDPDLSTR
jgi:hypothetical protein